MPSGIFNLLAEDDDGAAVRLQGKSVRSLRLRQEERWTTGSPATNSNSIRLASWTVTV